MLCIFCECEVEEFDFECSRHKTCPCGQVMLDCSETIIYKQLNSYKQERIRD